MVEQGVKKPRSAAEEGQILIEYAQGAEFGSAKYDALSDYLEMESLEEGLELAHRNARDAPESSKGRSHWESMVRVDEMKMALLAHSIRQNASRNKGYGAGYAEARSLIDNLRSAAAHDAHTRFPTDEGDNKILRETEFERICGEYHTHLEVIINAKSD